MYCKKYVFIVIILVFVVNMAFTKILDKAPDVSGHVTVQPQDDLFDFQISFDLETESESGLATYNDFIYTTRWNGNEIYKYDLEGTFISSFTIPGISHVRTLTYDGAYFYGSAASNIIYKMDFEQQSLVGTINSPVTVRAISYDNENDGFWVNNWSSDFTLIDRNGSILQSFSVGEYGSFYDLAYDNVLDEGPYLWGYSQMGNGNLLVQYDIGSTEVVNTFDINSLTQIPENGVAGGLFITDSIVYGKWSIIGLMQGELIWALELTDSADPLAPAAVENMNAVANASGQLHATLYWTNPQLQVNGEPLNELTSVNIYRNNELIHSNVNPTIGGNGVYTDTVSESGMYTYTLVGENAHGEGLPTSSSVWVGEDLPAAVSNLQLSQTGTDPLEATLTWQNPNNGLHGGPFNQPIEGYHIFRSDGVQFELTGLTTVFVDDTIITPGYYSYEVKAYNTIGMGGSAFSSTQLIAGPNSLLVSNFDEWLPDGWQISSTSGEINWQHHNGSNAGGSAPEAQFHWAPQNTGTQRLISPTINTSQFDEVSLEFKHSIDDFNGDYTLKLETSSDGELWNEVVAFPSQDLPPTTVDMDISNMDVGSTTFQIAWTFEGDSYNINNWYIDDIVLIGSGSPPQPGYIQGTISLSDGGGDITEVEVAVAYQTTTPNANGNYSFTLSPGEYNVIAQLEGYETAVFEDVVVVAGEVTDNVDLELQYIYPYNHPVNLSVDPETGLFSWDAPVYSDGLFEGFEGEDFPPAGWLTVNLDEGSGWELLEVGTTPIPGWDSGTAYAAPDGGEQMAFCSYLTGGDYFTDQWLITPQVRVGHGFVLSFYMRYAFNNFDDYIEILISTDSQSDPEDFSIIVDQIDLDANSSTEWVLYEYNLNDLVSAGTDVFVAFRQTIDDIWQNGSAIMIDNVYIDEQNSIQQTPLLSFGNHKDVNAQRELSFDDNSKRSNVVVKGRDEFLGYQVYLDGMLMGQTDDTHWYFEDLIHGESYVAGVRAVYDDGVSQIITYEFEYAGVSADNPVVTKTQLHKNYPNPFNPETTISFSINTPGRVQIDIYNIKGEKVCTLVREEYPAGNHSVVWNGTDNQNRSVASGVYMYRMSTENYSSTKKMILIK